MSIEQTAHNISALKVIQCDDVSTTVQLFKAVFLLLLNHCLLLLRVFFFCFIFWGVLVVVIQCMVSFLVLQPSG